jgi:glycosyltransferase involved in cell wall biosynthesis
VEIIYLIGDDFNKIKGGIENHAKILSTELKNHGFTVFTIDYSKLKFTRFKENSAIIVEGIHRYRLLKLMLTLMVLPRGPKLYIFTHGSFYYHLHSKELKKFGYKENKYLIKRIFDVIIMKKILSKFDSVIVLSEKEKFDIMKTFKLDSNKIVPLPVYSDEFDNIVENKLKYGDNYICYIGRIDKRKNVIELLNVAENVNFNVYVAGQDTGQLEEIMKVLREKKLSNFKYLGSITKSEKGELIKGSLCVVLPAYFEGMPLTACEALKLGKPVVMTKYSYMDPVNGLYTCEPNYKDLITNIEKARSTDLQITFISNIDITKKLISIIKMP